MRLKLFFLFAILHACQAFSQPVFMYPGDANNDGRADHFDILPVGIAYGQIGPPRDPALTDWALQVSEPWAPSLLPVSQIDLAFVNSNGDTLIDSLDIQAIASNYDSVQNNSMPPPIPYIERLTQFCFSCAPPDIVVTFSQDTVSGLDTFSAIFELRYPPNVLPQQGALGIAFDVEYEYDPEKIIDSLTQVIFFDDFDDRMYIAATHTKVTTAGLLPQAGKVEFGVAGKGQNVFFLPDNPLFVLEFVISDMIIRENAAEFFTLNISNILILNELEQIIGPGEIKTDTVVVDLKNIFREKLSLTLSPNPAHEMLFFDSADTPMEKIEIQNLAGKRFIEVDVAGRNRFELPVAALPPGVWLAVVRTKKGVVVKKFVKPD